MNDSASRFVVEIAREFTQLIISTELDWFHGYLRFKSEESTFGLTAAIAHSAGVQIVSALKNGDFFERINEICREMINSLESNTGVFLLIVDKNFNFEIKFEWKNLERWRISKLNGATGIPEGL